MMARRSVKGTADQDAIAALSSRPKHDRGWEAKQRKERGFVSYRGVPRDLQEQLKEVAKKLHVPVGDLARRFLEYGLAAYERGDLELRPVEIVKKATLYPDGT